VFAAFRGHLRNIWFDPGRWIDAFLRVGGVLLPHPEGGFSLSLVILAYLAKFLWPLQQPTLPAGLLFWRSRSVGITVNHAFVLVARISLKSVRSATLASRLSEGRTKTAQ